MKKNEKEKRIQRLLKEGVHVIDSGEGRAHCPVTGKVAECKPRDLVDSCQLCGRDGLTGYMM